MTQNSLTRSFIYSSVYSFIHSFSDQKVQWTAIYMYETLFPHTDIPAAFLYVHQWLSFTFTQKVEPCTRIDHKLWYKQNPTKVRGVISLPAYWHWQCRYDIIAILMTIMMSSGNGLSKIDGISWKIWLSVGERNEPARGREVILVPRGPWPVASCNSDVWLSVKKDWARNDDHRLLPALTTALTTGVSCWFMRLTEHRYQSCDKHPVLL